MDTRMFHLLQMARVDTLSLTVQMVTAVPHERRPIISHGIIEDAVAHIIEGN